MMLLRSEICAWLVFWEFTTFIVTWPLNGATPAVNVARRSTWGRQSFPRKLLLSTNVYGPLCAAVLDDFVARTGALVQPGDSAIFALLRTIDPDLVAAQFKGYGGTILRTTLNADQRAKVEQTLQSR